MAEAITINFTGKDNRGGTKTTKLHVPAGFTLAQYAEFAVSAAQIVANTMNGRLDSATISIPLTLVGATIKVAAIVLADLAERFVAMFRGATSAIKKLLRIPTLAETIITAGTDDVDTSDPAVTPFLSMVNSGIAVTGGTVTFCDNRSNDLTSLSYAKKGTDDTV
jgi:hypothetical protein